MTKKIVEQVSEREELIEQLITLRPDLTRTKILEKSYNYSKTKPFSHIDVIKRCIKLATNNLPLIWENSNG